MSIPIFLGAAVVGGLLGLAASKPSKQRSNPDRRARSTKTERDVCSRMGRKHLGGPGRADCSGGVEVKDWARPMSAYDVRKEAEKGRKIIVARGGFTDGARQEARAWGVRLRRS